MESFSNRMHPDDPRFEQWGQNLLDQDDESTKFSDSDDELEDTSEIEEIYEEDSDADYVPDEDSNNASTENDMENLAEERDKFYIGKNGFKW